MFHIWKANLRQSITPAVVRGYGLDDFDDLFQFSDDLPADPNELNDGLDEYELELLQNRENQTPERLRIIQ